MKKFLSVAVLVMAAAMLLTFTSSAYILIDSLDDAKHNNARRWVGTYIEACEDDPTEGDAYIQTKTVGGHSFIFKSIPAADLTEYTDGYYIFDFYVEDRASLTAGAIDLYTGEAITTFNLLDYLYQDGWNHISAKFTDGTPVVDGGIDYAEITSIRWYIYTTNNDNIIGVDNVGVGRYEDEREIMIESCESVVEESDFTGNSWGGWPMYLDEEGKAYYNSKDDNGDKIQVYLDEADAIKEGTGCIFNIQDVNFFFDCDFESPVDISDEDWDEYYFMFWLYLSDPYGTGLNGAVILSSSGVGMEESVSWSFANLAEELVEPGWIPVVIPMSEFGPNGTNYDIDPSNVNFIRFWDSVVAGEDVEMRLDHVAFGTYEDAVEYGFIVEEEATEEVTEEVTEEATEEVTEEATEEITEEVTEEATEEATEEVTEKAEGTAEPVTEEDSNTGLIIGIVIAAAVVVVAIIAFVVKKKK